MADYLIENHEEYEQITIKEPIIGMENIQDQV